MTTPVWRTFVASCLSLVLLSACQTPERRAVRERLDRIQAENSELKARSQGDVAQARMEMVRQRQDDLRVMESLTTKVDELNRKVGAIEARPSVAPAPAPTPVPPTETPKTPEPAKPDDSLAKELERVRAESDARMKRFEEELAKAQAAAEAAKLAAEAAQKTPQELKKDSSFSGKKLPLSKFVDSSGALVDLSTYAGKPVVLAVMKGFYSQGICVFCTRQTADLARNANTFKEMGAQVLVIYPGKEEHINTFVRSVRDYEKSSDPKFQLPFKVLLDVNQDAVRAFGIAGDLAHPTMFVLDSAGTVTYQYVGKNLSDRPSIQEVIEQARKVGTAKP